MVGKYTNLSDAYLSVIKALKHASFGAEVHVIIDWIEASKLEDKEKGLDPKAYEQAWSVLKNANGILVPGGFGDRGVEGKILAAKYARENKVPYFGICLGLQISVIEIARNVIGWKDANSEEFNPNAGHKVVVFMPEINRVTMGGTMRLGNRATQLQTKDCLAYRLYGNESISERHRHRYEINVDYLSDLKKAGMAFVGINSDNTGNRQEIVEIPAHPFYIGVQYHPEFKSRPTRPSPIFLGFVLAASNKLDQLPKIKLDLNNNNNGHY